MIRRPPRSTPLYSSAASDVYKRQAVRFGLWTMMAEACFSVYDFIRAKRVFRKKCLFSAIQQQTPQGHTTATGTVAAGRQAGKACSASCVFSYSCKNSVDLTAESFWYQLKSLTIPEAIRHPTRETQEHRVTNTHFAAAPSVYGCSHAGNHTRTFLPVPHRSLSYA